MIRKLLIANRGEIAVRVIRAAREMGIRTVAVYSEADSKQIHVALADEAVCLGPPEPRASYLDMGKVLAATKQTGADAIHPGYGFLSERAEFAEACGKTGIIFVGPPASAMRKLGAKIDAKQLAVSVGVPVTPGFFESGASKDKLKAAAVKIGFPVMLKASAGGGGRGMRVVCDADQFDEELAIASDEALKAFGDGAMMVEKLIERPRHIEVQVLADGHGNVACLFERECSIQRRHQKLIEESPSPVMSGTSIPQPPPPFAGKAGNDRQPRAAQMEEGALWPRMRDAVRSLILGAGYVGAGTVEFMFDEATGEFYFLEVNARLQVEHPVTEMITGLDLVKWQLRIASGETLDITPALLAGDRREIRGHAIEARIVAEDPASGFLPSVGQILAWAEPKAPGIRVDTGYGPGAEIPRYYDSLIAKVIAHAETRDEAINRLRAALLDFHILGVKTDVAFLLEVLDHEDFRAGKSDTGFLGREFSEWHPASKVPAELAGIAARAMSARSDGQECPPAVGVWDVADTFRLSKQP